jgi:hypothetical protein
MDQYHGTDKNNATTIIQRGVDVNRGGGELGKGFYTGNYEWEAFNWNWHKFRDKGSVIKFQIREEPFYRLEIRTLNVADGIPYYTQIKRGGRTRTYEFRCDVVWAVFLGYIPKSANAEQLKFESPVAQIFINGRDVNRQIV